MISDTLNYPTEWAGVILVKAPQKGSTQQSSGMGVTR
jgi:hypothetical protein